jgi:hypothetical protein
MKMFFLPRLLAAILISAVALPLLTTGCFGSKPVEFDDEGNVIMPAPVQKVKDSALSYAKEAGINFNGKWGNWLEAMKSSGEGMNFAGYPEHLDDLKDVCEQSRSFRVYILSAEDTSSDEYAVTMIYTAEAEPPITVCKAAPEMRSALEGKAAAEASAWNYNGDEDLACWSAYAPIYDGNGLIVAAIAVDYRARNITEYHEWNRDHPRWNGYTGE